MWMEGARASLSDSARTITTSGAAQLADRVQNRDLSANEVLEAHIETIEALNPSLNAIVIPLFESARAEAADIDERLAREEEVGPLAGVPVTIKELFDMIGTPSSLGFDSRDQLAEQDDPLVTRLRDTGAVPIGKTNLAQLIIFVESDNPVYGRTDNPWDLERTPGGSSGGEGAAVASGCSALGLGTDIGGSVRVPAHFSGICGLKPTSRRLPMESRIYSNFFPHQDTIVDQPGPFAREVADVDLCYRALAGPDEDHLEVADSWEGSLQGVRVGYYIDDGLFPASPSIRRAVTETAEALSTAGAVVSEFNLPQPERAQDLYYGILTADGAEWTRELLADTRVDRRVKALIRFASMPTMIRSVVTGVARLVGQRGLSDFLNTGGPVSDQELERMSQDLDAYRDGFLAAMGDIDLLVSPPFALPALTHGATYDVGLAGIYSFVYNLLGFPAGTVPVTQIQPDEESDREPSRELAFRRASKVEAGSAGLPVGVQIAGRPWREDMVLAAMYAVEAAFENRPDYPRIGAGS